AFDTAGKQIQTQTARRITRNYSLADGALLSEEKQKATPEDRYGVCFLRRTNDDTEVWVGPPVAVPPPIPADGRQVMVFGPGEGAEPASRPHQVDLLPGPGPRREEPRCR